MQTRVAIWRALLDTAVVSDGRQLLNEAFPRSSRARRAAEGTGGARRGGIEGHVIVVLHDLGTFREDEMIYSILVGLIAGWLAAAGPGSAGEGGPNW